MSTTTSAVIYSTECKNNCGILAHKIPEYHLEDDNSGYRWVRCTECGRINKVTE